MTQPSGKRRPEVDVIPLVSFPIRRTQAALVPTGISFVAAPLAGIWLAPSLWLGRKQVSLAHERTAESR